MSWEYSSYKTIAFAANECFDEFNPKKLVFLDPGGRWQENPITLSQCISHEILFQTWKLGKVDQAAFFQNVYKAMSSSLGWRELQEIIVALAKTQGFTLDSSERSKNEKLSPFLVIFGLLTWAMAYEALRLNCQLRFPEWDSAAKMQNQMYSQQLQVLNDLSHNLSGGPRHGETIFETTLKQLSPLLSDGFKMVPELVAEEVRLTSSLNDLLDRAKVPDRREEVYALIVQKLHPPMGIVTEISTAFLRPCVRLLLLDDIDISSGIQYNASVILSVLRDIRSSDALLSALSLFPVQYTKIRENLIYTLGNLREPEAVKPIVQVLNEPDSLSVSSPQEKTWFSNLTEQKEEAIQALGKIGLPSLQVLTTLSECFEHQSERLKTYLAWSLGEIGKAQMQKLGGISADIIITLLKLLRTKNRESFEESVSALKKMSMPEFLHALYLYDIGAVNILGLKPAQKGLYELSETLNFLIKTKGQAIVAVNGDSGTGKTYFCHAIVNGFGEIKPEEILYLMRDRRKDQKIFNRFLGLKWLQQYIDPAYYQDYPLAEEMDNPEEFFNEFIKKHSNKKLILLDGCRDRHYFQRIIDIFYLKGRLDVEVNFRATYSTRRANLEEREMALESVKTHLAFLEEPALEDTLFYQEGKVLLYDLDNSTPYRLGQQEIRELFQKIRIQSWGDLICLGSFNQEAVTRKIRTENLEVEAVAYSPHREEMPEKYSQGVLHKERKFHMEANTNYEDYPHLLGSINVSDIKPRKICFYAQAQIAGLGDQGNVFVLTFLDNRIFYTQIEGGRDITLLGRDIFLISDQGGLLSVSFEKNQEIRFNNSHSPIVCLNSFPLSTILSGHEDGSVRIWDFKENKILLLKGHEQPICGIAVDYYGCIYSASTDQVLKRWDPSQNLVQTVSVSRLGEISRIEPYSQMKLLMLSDVIHILDWDEGLVNILSLPAKRKFGGLVVNPDGRIITSLSDRLAVISLEKYIGEFQFLKCNTLETYDCLTQGPKIISCGREAENLYDIRLSGNEYFVRHELSKLSLQE